MMTDSSRHWHVKDLYSNLMVSIYRKHVRIAEHVNGAGVENGESGPENRV